MSSPSFWHPQPSVWSKLAPTIVFLQLWNPCFSKAILRSNSPRSPWLPFLENTKLNFPGSQTRSYFQAIGTLVPYNPLASRWWWREFKTILRKSSFATTIDTRVLREWSASAILLKPVDRVKVSLMGVAGLLNSFPEPPSIRIIYQMGTNALVCSFVEAEVN